MNNDHLMQPFHVMAESVLLTLLEPESIEFRREHDVAARRIVAVIHRVDDHEAAELRLPVNRNGFLLGCLEYTDERIEEHLIVGYGFRHGSTTKIERIHHVVGSPDSVPIPPEIAGAVWEHYEARDDNEVVLFHNHPRWWLNLFFDNTPLASPADRNVLARAALSPPRLLRTLVGGGRALFFLGENGRVKQFRLPRVMPLLQGIQLSSRV